MSPPGIAVRPHTLQNHAHRPCPREAPASRVPKLTVRASIIVQVPPPGAQQLRLGTENDAPPSSHVLRGEMLPASGMVAVVWAPFALCALRRLIGSAHDARALARRGALPSVAAALLCALSHGTRIPARIARAAAQQPVIPGGVCVSPSSAISRALVGDFEGLDEAPRRF